MAALRPFLDLDKRVDNLIFQKIYSKMKMICQMEVNLLTPVVERFAFTTG